MAAVLFEPLISNLLYTPQGQSAPQNRAYEENSNPVPFKTLFSISSFAVTLRFCFLRLAEVQVALLLHKMLHN